MVVYPAERTNALVVSRICILQGAALRFSAELKHLNEES
jgi:hypothetical protein